VLDADTVIKEVNDLVRDPGGGLGANASIAG
jgi:hypothetical protein